MVQGHTQTHTAAREKFAVKGRAPLIVIWHGWKSGTTNR